MRLTIFYPESSQEFAGQVKFQLQGIRGLDFTWVETNVASFRSDLEDAAESDDPLIVVLSSGLVAGLGIAPRVLWAPLLKKIEEGDAGGVGLILLDSIATPPLLKKMKWAEGKVSLRAIQQWVMQWLGVEVSSSGWGNGLSVGFTSDQRETLLETLVDRQGMAELSCPCIGTQTKAAFEAARLLRPYFESITIREARQEIPALRDAVIAELRPGGRALWILVGYEGPPIQIPADGSLLVIGRNTGMLIEGEPGDVTRLDEILRAAALIQMTPTVEGLELPYSTYEFEVLLPELFRRNWLIAERLARKAGSFFRVNHRVAEAIWVYETLKEEAAAQGNSKCVTDCESELYWLRAGGIRKQQFLEAGQGSFNF